jgi:hypothetical protein
MHPFKEVPMSQNLHLQHLFIDPRHGYLYPHAKAIAALGVANEYQINKHRPKLAEGQHWHKIRGADHVDRVFYSLSGLELLAQFVATPEAQAFWESVNSHTQPGGALVQVQPATLYREIEAEVSDIEVIEPTATEEFQKPELSQLLALALARKAPVQYPTHPSAQSGAGGYPSTTLTPQETAALIFKAQEVLGEQLAKNSRPSVGDRPQERDQSLRHEITIWQKWDSYIAAQDGVALGIVYALLCVMVGFSAYYAVEALRQPSSPAIQQPVQSVP